MIVIQIIKQQIKLFIERRLGLNVVFKFFACSENGFRSQFHNRKIQCSFYKLSLIQKQLFRTGVFDILRQFLKSFFCFPKLFV
ncbi:hypothetical protein D3C86_991730 [compost metagenome]